MVKLELNTRIYLAGHRGLVGSAILKRLHAEGFSHLITRKRAELDLRDQAAVNAFFFAEEPEIVILAAAKVGGILANATYPADYLYDNLMIAANVVEASYQTGAKKLLNLGSSCIYPKIAPQPLKEECLLTGPLEPTNRAYAVAKIAAIELCDRYRAQYGCDFVSAMPTNLYGPNDNFDLETSHVLPALIRKFHEAKQHGATSVTLWGTGRAKREFLYVDDLADACLFILRHVSEPGPINVGTGEELTILELAQLVQEVVGYRCEIEFDTSKPDGTPRKLLDITRLSNLGWKAKTPLDQGIRQTYQWALHNEDSWRTKEAKALKGDRAEEQ